MNNFLLSINNNNNHHNNNNNPDNDFDRCASRNWTLIITINTTKLRMVNKIRITKL
jgi:hypothetical protein